MNNVLITIGVLIVAVLSALFAIPYFVDWNSYRGVIEEEASRIVGRDVRIGGDIALQLLPTPSFVIHRLRVADTASGSGEPLFRADVVDAKLSIVPLVRGVLEANQIELVKPVLRLVLDENGQGNWRSIVKGRGSLPFVPSDVALQSVKITDGALSLFDHAGNRQRVTLDHIGGQLSAPTLDGPYRFRGLYGAGAETRDLRFTTLPADADGTIQIKATLRDVVSNASATVDGRVRNLSSRPELTGQLSGLLPLPNTSVAAAGKPSDAKAAAPIADLKANIVANATTLELSDLSVAFEGSGRPEILAGNTIVSWENERTIVTTLSAPWIDLDNVLGNPDGAKPLQALGAFAQHINTLVSGVGTARAVLDIDQANLGHDVVGGIRLEVRSSAGMLAVERLRASLPGGTKVEMLGRIAGEGVATSFDGDMTVRGNSLARLTGWATSGGITIDPANDQSFQMRARVTAEPARGGLRDIVADIGDSTIEGEIDYAWAGAKKLRVTLDGGRVDARALGWQHLTLRALSDWMVPEQSSGDHLDVAVDLKTAELVLGAETLRDVAAKFDRTAKGVGLEQLQFSAEHGVAVAMSGQLDGQRQLRGSVAADDRAGIDKLSKFFDFPLAALVPSDVLADLLPLRLAGSLMPGDGAGKQATTITADGRTGLADTKISATFGAGPEDWRNAPADFDIVVLASPEAQLTTRLFAAMGLPTAAPTDAKMIAASKDSTTRLALRATGVPADGLSTAIRFDSSDLTFYVDGLAHVSSSGAIRLAGDLTVDARDVRPAFAALAGLRLALPNSVMLQGSMRVDVHDGGIDLSRLAVVAGAGATITGKLAYAPRSPDASSVERHLRGTLAISSADLTTLLSPVLQTRNSDVQSAIQVTSGRAGVWPEATFEFGRNNGVLAELVLTVGRVALSDDVGINNAGMTIVTGPKTFELRNLTGKVLGGKLSTDVMLEGSTSGANLTSRIAIAGIDLGAFGPSGSGDLDLSLVGRGINPAGLISSVSGSGTLKLGALQVRELTPATITSVIDGALKVPADKLNGVLRLGLAAEQARGALETVARTLPLTVQDGVVKTGAVSLVAQAGRVGGQLALDLASFGVSGDWRVEARMPPLPPLPALPGQPVEPPSPTPATLLPPVVQRFTLRPADLDPARKSRRQAPESDALEKEIAVRKVERDLAELERLRRLDEERAAAALAEAEKSRQADSKPNGTAVPPPPQ